MTGDQRARLARQQAELLAALTAGGSAPEGFDTARLKAQSEMLAAKRRSVLRKNTSDLADHLGDRFPALCNRYCEQHPLESGDDHNTDAANFRAWLTTTGELPSPTRFQRLRTTLRRR